MFKLQNGFTKEKMIEKIVKYNNGQKSGYLNVSGYYSCMYSVDNDTNRCAIGCFIPDNHKALNAKNISVSGLLIDYPDLVEKMPLESLGLGIFQTIHDRQRSGVFIQDKLIQWIHDNVKE